MKILKNILKCTFWLLILALLVSPLGLIFYISSQEMEAYQPPEAPLLQETAYGAVAQARRQDVEEYITVAGTFVSRACGYMELEQEFPSRIRWDVSVGDEVQEGQVLGTYQGTPVVSTLNGILVENNSYSAGDAYLKVQLLEPLELECRVTDRVLTSLKRYAEELTTEDGTAVTVTYTGIVKDANGTTLVRLAIDSEDHYYGEVLPELRLLTGRSYSQTLVLDASCLYQKEPGENNPWYARRVTAEGLFLGEVTVQVGYSNGDVVCVSGVNEGDYFDTGYQAIAQGGVS